MTAQPEPNTSGEGDGLRAGNGRLSNHRLQFDYFDRATPTYAVKRMDFARVLVADEARPSARILDVGCGDGALMRVIAGDHPHAELVGIDPAPNYVERARRQGIDARVGSVLDPELIVDLGEFDYVVLASVLHHLVDRSWRRTRRNAEQAVSTCLGALAPDGRLILFETCLAPSIVGRLTYWIKLCFVALGRNRRLDLGWVNLGAPLVAFFGRTELAKLVARCGGQVIEAHDVSRRTHLGFLTRHGVGLVVGRRPGSGGVETPSVGSV